jgi:transposase
LSPIENVWHLLKRRVTKRRPKNKEDLHAKILEEWENFPQETIQDLYDTMHRRIEALVQANGHQTKY